MKSELTKYNMLKVETNVLYSGECDWPFSVRICSIENLMQALELDGKHIEMTHRATYNGLIPPQYITKKVHQSENDAHKIKSAPENEMVNHKQVHLKLHKRSGRATEIKSLEFAKNFIPFGG